MLPIYVHMAFSQGHVLVLLPFSVFFKACYVLLQIWIPYLYAVFKVRFYIITYLRQVNEVSGGDNAFVRCVSVCLFVCAQRPVNGS